MRLLIEPEIWPVVRHLFEGKVGHWAEGVHVGGTCWEPIIVDCPEQIGTVAMALMSDERIPFVVG
jgi:hypothetical protein